MAKLAAKKERVYDESSISGFKRDLDKIRAKPAMYIGPIDGSGIFTILRELLDNAVDEARAGRNDIIRIYIDKGVFWVSDNGVGIPVKKHATMGISTLTHVLTNIQSSGKMKAGAYTSAIGTHGVGQKATNALSKQFQCWTYRKDAGGWHTTAFAQGKETKKVGKCNAPKLPDGKKPKLGTVISFSPDEKIFGKAKLDVKKLHEWCEITAYMNAKLRIELWDNGKVKSWYSKEGIKSYLEKLMTDLKATSLSKKFVFCNSQSLEMALHFADVEGEEVTFYTNTIKNVDKGVHADSFYKALFDSLKPYKKKNEYTPSDLREGLVGIFNYKVDAPQFSSQTKEKLVDVRVKEPCYQECLEVLTKFWTENKSLAAQVVSRAAELRKRTADFLKDKKLIKNVRAAHKGLAAKLADVANSKTPFSEREIYLVEGDSAGGTGKVARDKNFQAVFSLKGKPLNVMEASKDKVNGNKEIAGILAGIGLDLGHKTPLDNIKFGKIIFLADGDVDGKHINCLLMGLFWKYLPDLFRQGMIYMVDAPEYMCKHKGKTYFSKTKKGMYKKVGAEKIDIRHIKGWGELDAVDLQPIAFDLKGRKLLRVLPPKEKKGVLEFQALLGKHSGFRKKLLGIA